MGWFIRYSVDEELSVFVYDFAIQNPRADLINEYLVALLEDYMQSFLKPEIAVQVFFKHQINNITTSNSLIVYLVNQRHKLW